MKIRAPSNQGPLLCSLYPEKDTFQNLKNNKIIDKKDAIMRQPPKTRHC